VRIVVAPIAREAAFAAVEGQIRVALQAALRLLSWYRQHVAKLPPNGVPLTCGAQRRQVQRHVSQP
jgi:hypothetical protein